jgi:hypothetical protein
VTFYQSGAWSASKAEKHSTHWLNKDFTTLVPQCHYVNTASCTLLVRCHYDYTQLYQCRSFHWIYHDIQDGTTLPDRPRNDAKTLSSHSCRPHYASAMILVRCYHAACPRRCRSYHAVTQTFPRFVWATIPLRMFWTCSKYAGWGREACRPTRSHDVLATLMAIQPRFSSDARRSALLLCKI